MGSIYAARFANAGHSVTAVDTWADHVRAIVSKGLRVDGPAGPICAKMAATTDAKTVPTQDLYIIATKASGVAQAVEAIKPKLDPKGKVLTIQNGLGAGERMVPALPESQVFLGVAEGFGASMIGPGHATHTSMKQIRIGHVNGGASDGLNDLVKIWQQAGFQTSAYDDIEQLIWEKFLCNVTLSGPCTTFRCNVRQLLETSEWWDIALGCMYEAWEIGKARNVAFTFADPREYVTAFAHKVGTAKPSMLQDHEARRVSELDAINGAVGRLGRDLDIPTPFNDTLTAVLRQREAGF